MHKIMCFHHEMIPHQKYFNLVRLVLKGDILFYDFTKKYQIPQSKSKAKRKTTVVLMLGQRHRRWSNIRASLVQHLPMCHTINKYHYEAFILCSFLFCSSFDQDLPVFRSPGVTGPSGQELTWTRSPQARCWSCMA